MSTHVAWPVAHGTTGEPWPGIGVHRADPNGAVYPVVNQQLARSGVIALIAVTGLDRSPSSEATRPTVGGTGEFFDYRTVARRTCRG